MTYQTIMTASPAARLADSFRRYRDRLAEQRRRSVIYSRTFRDLSAMSERELLDIGIDRADIATVARQAAGL